MLQPNMILQGRYQIIRELGAGAMGAVYLANHLALGKRVAIKENILGEAMAVKQFQTEAAILANLSHPNLPSVTDFFIEPNGTRYLVMDYIDGQNLEQMVEQRGALNERDALAWMAQVFEAVKYLHANRIIHRDIKPQNIIITPSGKAMLVDFGIAKVHAPGMPTMSGAHGVGTPGYAPLEQYSGGTDERSDIYALGATLYFLLTAQSPQDAPMRAATKSTLVLPRQMNEAVSQNTETVILTAMNLAASDRYSSVSALELALKPQAISINVQATAVLTNQASAATATQSIGAQKPGFVLPVPLLIAISIGVVVVVVALVALLAQPQVSLPLRASYPNASTVEIAQPYATAQVVPLPAGQGVSASRALAKPARVVDLWVELANDSPADVSVFIAPFCNEIMQFAGSTHMESSSSIRPVYIPVGSPIPISGKICVSVQAAPGARVSIAKNQFGEPLIKVVISYE